MESWQPRALDSIATGPFFHGFAANDNPVNERVLRVLPSFTGFPFVIPTARGTRPGMPTWRSFFINQRARSCFHLHPGKPNKTQ